MDVHAPFTYVNLSGTRLVKVALPILQSPILVMRLQLIHKTMYERQLTAELSVKPPFFGYTLVENY